MIQPQEEIVKISEYVHSLGLTMHCDGARIWEVAAQVYLSLSLFNPHNSFFTPISFVDPDW